MPTLKLAVPGLHGPDDARRIEESVRSVPGVFGVCASCEQKRVDIDFDDDDVGLSELRDRLCAHGFAVRLAG